MVAPILADLFTRRDTPPNHALGVSGTATSLTSLLDLPVELYLLIIEYLSISDFANLLLSHNRFMELLEGEFFKIVATVFRTSEYYERKYLALHGHAGTEVFSALRVWANSTEFSSNQHPIRVSLFLRDRLWMLPFFASTIRAAGQKFKDSIKTITLYIWRSGELVYLHDFLVAMNAISPKNWTELEIDTCGVTGQLPDESVIPDLNSLTSLHLAGVNLTNPALQSMLSSALGAGSITELSLKECVTQHILCRPFPTLQTVTLSVDYGIDKIFDFLSHNPQLQSVDLEGTPRILKASTIIHGTLNLHHLGGTAFVVNRIIRQFSTCSLKLSLDTLCIYPDFAQGDALNWRNRDRWLSDYDQRVLEILSQCQRVGKVRVELPIRRHFSSFGPRKVTPQDVISTVTDLSISTQTTGYSDFQIVVINIAYLHLTSH